MLQKDPNKRIGSTFGAIEILEHPFCMALDHAALERKEIPPPTFFPSYQDTNFDFEAKILPVEFQDA